MNNSTDLKTFHKMGLFAIPLLKYIKKHDFKVFGIYRIILGIAVLVYFAVN